jgi:hypothetical protein
MLIDAVSDALTLLCWVAIVGAVLAGFCTAILTIIRLFWNAATGK